ncbi:unnamed protein product [Adineta ricciae]|uniref:Uncharacterized protein n=1 Tax=Adineta ricciae TaxID=249248 RepID=A0A815IB54_ADIRI|nr:unnamed protein product [Adineta ricciae]CAF1649827.1 unnamed protein product [Adineta ricciae]
MLSEVYCSKCNNASTSKCLGCSEIFCLNHFLRHREELDVQLDPIKSDCDDFEEKFYESTKNREEEDRAMQLIGQWEGESIRLIQECANYCRQSLNRYREEVFTEIKSNFTEITSQLESFRETRNFHEQHLRKLSEQLGILREQLRTPSIPTIQRHSRLFVDHISLTLPYERLFSTKAIPLSAKWKQNGLTIAGGNGDGKQLNQLNRPFDVYFNPSDQTMYISDTLGDRIVQWKYGESTGYIIAGGNENEDEVDSLICAASVAARENRSRVNLLVSPSSVIVDERSDSLIIYDRGHSRIVRWDRQNSLMKTIVSNISGIGLTMDIHGNLYASDTVNHEVKRWKRGDAVGVVVAGGHGMGCALNQLNYPSYIFVDEDLSVYVSDSKNDRVMKWEKDATEGMIVAGGNGRGNTEEQLNRPHGIVVDRLRNVYVADRDNYRVVCWPNGSQKGHVVVGGNGKGDRADQLDQILGLAFDQQKNLWVTDCGNHRIQVFEFLNPDLSIKPTWF